MSKRARTDSASSGSKKRMSKRQYIDMINGYPKKSMMQYLPRSDRTKLFYGPSWKAASADQRALRKDHRVYGYGRYTVRDARRLVARGARSRYARQAIDMWGGAYAPALQMARKAIGGRGQYVGGVGHSANQLLSGGAGSVPKFSSKNDEQGDMVITHSEYVGDLYGTPTGVTFENNVFDINPGLEKTFPWLSQIACNFEEYELIQLSFTFRSTISDIGSSSTGQVGTVILGTNYNPAAEEFSDKAVMLQYAHTCSDKATMPQTHFVECDPDHNRGSPVKTVRTSGVPSGTDAKLYDLGKFQAAVHGTPAGYDGQSIGELWVSYTVKLNKPKLVSGIGLAISTDLFMRSTATTDAINDGDILGLDSDVVKGSENGIGLELAMSGGVLDITFPASAGGWFDVELIVVGSALSQNGVLATSGDVLVVGDSQLNDPSTSGKPGFSTSFAMTTTDNAIIKTRVKVGRGNSESNVLHLPSFNCDSCNSASLRVTEYNPTSKQPPIMLDVNGSVVSF